MSQTLCGGAGEGLAQMVAELVATWREQAAVSRWQVDELQDQTESRMHVIVILAARLSSWPTPLPAHHRCMGVAGVRPAPVPRVRPARMPSASTPVPTPQVEAAGACWCLHPFLLPGGGPLSNLRVHHQLTHLLSRGRRNCLLLKKKIEDLVCGIKLV